MDRQHPSAKADPRRFDARELTDRALDAARAVTTVHPHDIEDEWYAVELLGGCEAGHADCRV
jgi:hypothetical protein